ncbi:MAG: YihY/virulence factor BrkB family protein [Paludibacteraceae bacterium]|nr:YihY/virulence factor BrkB family protein [Paludibacteraceae bacterium]
MKVKFSDIIKFVRYDMWRVTTNELDSFIKRLGYQIIRTIVLVARGFGSKNLNDTAKSLTYSLIFAIVPILAMVMAVANGFGVADVIEQQLNASFLGETNMVPTIMAMVQRYLETAQGGVFIGIGILILLWAVYSFFQSVETAFNRIWNVHKSRSILHQATTYIAIVVLIPVLIVCSAGINIFVHSAVESTLHVEAVHNFLQTSGVKFLQFVMCWLLFTVMYVAIPNTKVRFMSALIPGIIMGSLFQLLQMLSVYIIASLSRTSIVYGAFATVPILMTWLQYTSLLILIGAEMSYAIQNNEEFEYEQDLNQMSRRYKDFVMLYLLSVIIRRFENDEEPLSAHELAIRDHLPIRLVNQLLGRMVETGVLREVFVEGNEDKTYQPALDTHKISVGMVIGRIEAQGTELFLQSPSEDMQAFWEGYKKVKDLKNERMKDILISDIK